MNAQITEMVTLLKSSGWTDIAAGIENGDHLQSDDSEVAQAHDYAIRHMDHLASGSTGEVWLSDSLSSNQYNWSDDQAIDSLAWWIDAYDTLIAFDQLLDNAGYDRLAAAAQRLDIDVEPCTADELPWDSQERWYAFESCDNTAQTTIRDSINYDDFETMINGMKAAITAIQSQ